MAMLEKLFSRNRPQKLIPENGQQRVIPEADYQRYVFYEELFHKIVATEAALVHVWGFSSSRYCIG